MSEMETVLDVLLALQTEPKTGEIVITKVLHVPLDEALALVTSICEWADEDKEHHPAALGFTMGLAIGERLGFGRGATLFGPGEAQEPRTRRGGLRRGGMFQ